MAEMKESLREIRGKVISVQDVPGGREVKLAIRPPFEMFDKSISSPLDNRARARALVASGLASEGFLRDPDVAIDAPEATRKTKILSKNKMGNAFKYTIMVRGGVVLQ